MQKQRNPSDGERAEVAQEARGLIRRGLKGALATISRGAGHPSASLITLATQPDGAPLFLISTLAQHTQNIAADARAAVLFDGTDGYGDPLEGGRVSVFGAVEKAESDQSRSRFLARHPNAEMYVDFSDFAFCRLRLEGAHFVGGFGRIYDFEPGELLTELKGAETLVAAEAEIVEHMNSDHAEAVELYATRFLGASAGPWRFTGCDPEGCDLVLGQAALRLVFPERVTSPQAMRETLANLARQARG